MNLSLREVFACCFFQVNSPWPPRSRYSRALLPMLLPRRLPLSRCERASAAKPTLLLGSAFKLAACTPAPPFVISRPCSRYIFEVTADLGGWAAAVEGGEVTDEILL